MRIEEANRLLDPGYLPTESGWVRHDDGTLHVASRTAMPGCKGRMIDFWFGFLRTTEHYKWWHPTDHVWCEWVGERGTGQYVGGTHNVHEYIGGELAKLRIHFRPPSEYLDVARFADAGVSTAVCARVGLLEAPVWTGHVIHLIRDTDWGCEMRSRFWLGHFDPPGMAPTPEACAALIPDAIGAGLHKHCNEEMGYLADFLPRLYAKEAR
jgi:hypothetical protein